MPWPYKYGLTAQVHRAQVDDRTQDRGTEQPVRELEHCSFDRGSTSGSDDAGDAGTETRPRLFAAYDADVDPRTDQISIEGYPGRWDVDGDVLRHRSALTGDEACSEIRLIRRKGAR